MDLTLTEILPVTLLALVIAALLLTPHTFEDKRNRRFVLSFGFFAILIIVTGFLYYKQTKDKLVDCFYGSQELLCKDDSEKKLIISKAKGFVLQSDYFISDAQIVYIGGCILLEDPIQKTKKAMERNEFIKEDKVVPISECTKR